MKPAWDKLMGEFKGHPSALIADVDCTAAGQALCQKQGVQGYPTIKYGDPKSLKDYQGGRDFDSMKQFADANLGPKCSPENLDLCKGKVKEKYEELLKMDEKVLEGEIRTKRQALKKEEEELQLMKDVSKLMRKREREKKETERKAAKAEKKRKEKEEAEKKKKEEAEKKKAEL